MAGRNCSGTIRFNSTSAAGRVKVEALMGLIYLSPT